MARGPQDGQARHGSDLDRLQTTPVGCQQALFKATRKQNTSIKVTEEKTDLKTEWVKRISVWFWE